MIHRTLNLLLSNTFFLFGARGTGKSTLIREQMQSLSPLTVDLLLPKQFDRYSTDPELLIRELELLPSGSWVVIDEVQRVPALLDVVHHQIENRGINFALTGSSARKLRRGAANMLGGRAFTFYLYPLTSVEIGAAFNLMQALRFGTLPKVWHLGNDQERALSLETYALTYLQEEIWGEHLIRDLPPFRRFISVAAQMNGEIVNYSKISQDVQVDDKTVREYFQILEDTLVGYMLEPYSRSVRKRQRSNPKFYFFDTGVSRGISGVCENILVEGSSEYGRVFEQWLITEIIRLSDYCRKKFSFSYLRTQANVEIDLIIEKVGEPNILVEIKSSSQVTENDTNSLHQLLPDFSNARAYCFSNDPKTQKFGKVIAMHWKEGLKELGLVP